MGRPPRGAGARGARAGRAAEAAWSWGGAVFGILGSGRRGVYGVGGVGARVGGAFRVTPCLRRDETASRKWRPMGRRLGCGSPAPGRLERPLTDGKVPDLTLTSLNRGDVLAAKDAFMQCSLGPLAHTLSQNFRSVPGRGVVGIQAYSAARRNQAKGGIVEARAAGTSAGSPSLLMPPTSPGTILTIDGALQAQVLLTRWNHACDCSTRPRSLLGGSLFGQSRSDGTRGRGEVPYSGMNNRPDPAVMDPRSSGRMQPDGPTKTSKGEKLLAT